MLLSNAPEGGNLHVARSACAARRPTGQPVHGAQPLKARPGLNLAGRWGWVAMSGVAGRAGGRGCG
eukprot:scaffold77125_cov73-Phaeocystis_antarctica.AAC.2